MTVLGLTCLLGMTWALAFLSFGVFLIPQLILFTIINSLLGQRCCRDTVFRQWDEWDGTRSSIRPDAKPCQGGFCRRRLRWHGGLAPGFYYH
ncbi:adhesion G protein-coupled receptor G5 [Chelydra serpentina]|uniref:Adhesion G protein-coupled receptor G5 n=1 Tax=Chelydra serpentina TaxID=8475 RepID=A0A8T1SEK6_CHESE|nr:adhesion G protein-coupled receptor G5 [Chelydra serpentina]